MSPDRHSSPPDAFARDARDGDGEPGTVLLLSTLVQMLLRETGLFLLLLTLAFLKVLLSRA